MSIVKLSYGLIMAASLIPVAVHAAATDSAIVDDFEAGSNQNRFGAYTFFYADATDGGTTVVNSATVSGTEMLFDAAKSLGEGANGSKNSLKLDFKYGANKPTCGTGCTYGQMAGVGTGFIADGKVLDLTGATNITFYAKASAAMTMRVEIATKPVTNFGYHVFNAILTTSWQKYTLPLVEGPDFQQPAWAATADPQPFDPSQVEKIQFSISADDNTGLTAGIVNLDDIVVHGYKWVPPNACIKCVGVVGTGAILSNMETAPKNKNAAGGYWYAYNDAEGRTVTAQSQYSEIFEGVVPDTLDPTKPSFKVSEGKGATASAGAEVGFTLGPTYLQGTETIMPFVGLGTKVSDALGTMFSNWSASTGISFDYWTSATSNFEYLRVEAKANQDFGNAGIVHSVLLPTTAGLWKSATIKWTDFSLPDWDEVKLIPAAQQALLLSAMDKIQWAVQGAPGTTGAIAVDNVKVEGLATIPTLAPIRRTLGMRASNFAISQGLHQVNVALQMGEAAQTATVRMIDMKGHVVASNKISGSGLQMSTLNTNALNSGVYSIQVKMGDRVLPTAMTVLP